MLTGLWSLAPGNCPSICDIAIFICKFASLSHQNFAISHPWRFFKSFYLISKIHFWLKPIKKSEIQNVPMLEFFALYECSKSSRFATSDFDIRDTQSLKSETFRKLKNSIIWILLVPRTSRKGSLTCNNS